SLGIWEVLSSIAAVWSSQVARANLRNPSLVSNQIKKERRARNFQTAAPATIDLATIKRRQQAAWGSGDYAIIGTTLQIVGERLAKPSICAAASVSSMSPPATATPRSPRRAASPTS